MEKPTETLPAVVILITIQMVIQTVMETAAKPQVVVIRKLREPEMKVPGTREKAEAEQEAMILMTAVLQAEIRR